MIKRLLSPAALLLFVAAASAQQQPPPQARPQTQKPPAADGCARELVAYAERARLTQPAFTLDLAAPAGGRLYYFGAQHSTDPAHAQVSEIEKAWGALKPTVAFYEGPDRPAAATAAETVAQAGESGLVRFLAARDGVPARTLEPPPHEEAAHVMTKFTKEQALLFYVLRETARLRERRKLPEDELKKTVARLLERVSKMPWAGGVIADTDALAAAYRKYWSEPADWWQAPARWFDPVRTSAETGGVFTNEVNRMSSEYRDLHMYRALAGAALAGERVFAVVGRDHVPAQSRALKCALK